MTKFTKSNIKRAVAAVFTLAIISTALVLAIPGKDSVAEDKYPIMGPTNVTVGQLMNYYNSVTSFPEYYKGTDAPTLDAFCQIYLDECNAEGVRVEVAFCQAMNETNYLRYTGRVPIEANNFAGIGAVDSDERAWSVFSSVREGIRAHVQHLKAYASTAALNNPCVDPRFNLVTRGIAPYLEDLSGRWASSPTYGTDIRNNFMSKLGTFNGFNTMYNGVEYSSIYDPEYYLERYPDVAAAYANDGYALIAHFVNYGIDEGRIASAYFSPYVYKSNYVDLRNAFGYSIGTYTRHYISSGQSEGRQGWLPNGSTAKAWVLDGVNYSNIYSYDYYVSANPDVTALVGTDDLDVLSYFVNYGMDMGQRASKQFDVTSYRNEYPDLRSDFGHGNRSYYMHYLNSGQAEGRHGTGCSERVGAITRIWILEYADVYDFNYYQQNNPDVAAAFGDDDIATLEHFMNYGMKEGRRASANFDVWAYGSKHPDLSVAFWLNMPEYYIHYINYGRAEGRIAV